MQLSKNPRFVQEHQEFSAKIHTLANQELKSECVQLLNDLLRNVQQLDQQLVQYSSSRMCDQLDHARQQIQAARKKLMARLKDN